MEKNKRSPYVFMLLFAAMLLGAFGSAAQNTWYLFDSYLENGKPRATITNPDADGTYTFEFQNNNNSRTNFYFTNNRNPYSEEPGTVYYGYTSDYVGCITVTDGLETDLVDVGFSNAYGDRGGFEIPYGSGKWIIKFNPTAAKVSFSQKAPDTIYFVDFDKSFGSATNDGDGIFTFEGVVPSSAYPYYGFSPTAIPRDAGWILSAADASEASRSNNITVEPGVTYELHNSSWDAINSESGSFVLEKAAYDITLDWNAKTVVFTKAPIRAPERLYFVDYNVSFGYADKEGDGIYHFENITPKSAYPYYGFAPIAKPAEADWVIATVPQNEATRENNIFVQLNEDYTWAFSSQEALNAETGSFCLAKNCTFDVTLDWNAGTVTFTQKEQPAPDQLWIGRGPVTYGNATNDGSGIYKFTNVKLRHSEASYAFFDAATQGECNLLVGGSIAPADIEIVPGETTPWAFISKWQLNDKEGAFAIADGDYDITLDWNARTVLFAEHEVEAPATIWLVDYANEFGSAQNNGYGIYKFESVSVASSYPYYGFADNSNPQSADVMMSAVKASEATSENNVNVEKGLTYPLARSSWSAINDMIGSFVLESGSYDITLDWNAKTVTFEKPHIDTPARLIATDTYLEEIMGSAVNNGNGVFEMVIDLNKSSALIVFTNNEELKNESGETLYYGSDGDAVRNVEFGKSYDIGKANYTLVWNDATGFRFEAGRYKAIVDFNEGTVVFSDISRGDTWEIPETLSLFDDTLEQLATAEKIEDGVFQFNAISLENAAKVVFAADDNEDAKIFGSSMRGETSLEVKNFRTYDLYIPTRIEVLTDGTSCFLLPAGTWNIKADFNAKNVYFEAPDAEYFPEELAVAVNGTVTNNRASGNYAYTWKLTLPETSAVTFSDPLTGRTYGSPEADVDVTPIDDFSIEQLSDDELHSYQVPAGTWEVVLNLKTGKVNFYEYKAIQMTESSMTNGDKFYSYWGAGTDPLMTMEFNGNPYTVSCAYIALGDYTPGMKKSTETCTIEDFNKIYRSGNFLLADFSGIVRMMPDSAENKKVTFVLTEIKSVHGLPIECEAIEGLPAGSLMFSFEFEEYVPQHIESKMLDADGNAIEPETKLNVDETERVTIMVKPYDLITFDDILLTPYVEEQSEESPVKADAETILLQWEADQEATDSECFTPIRVKIPMRMRGTGSWALSISNLNIDNNVDSVYVVRHLLETNVHPATMFTTDPANGSELDELQDIILTWEHPIVRSAGYNGVVEPEVTVTDASGATMQATLTANSSLSDKALQVHLAEPIRMQGIYTVLIPQGCVTLNDEPDTNSPEIRLSYEISGSHSSIEEIIAANPDAETYVCTLSGILLRNGRAADVLRSLDKGVYIINGVKVDLR